MPYLEPILSAIIILLGVRTLCWHLQCWQLREYRWDRMRAWLRTDDGQRQYFTPWFSRGLLPRPKLSARIGLAVLLILALNLVLYLVFYVTALWYLAPCALIPLPPGETCSVSLLVTLLPMIAVERTLWLQTGLAIYLSNIPVRLKKLHLFAQAGRVVKNGDPNIVRIGITGSYGKSSTKELLVHLLKSEFGKDSVLYNPANENTEVAIARLILKHKEFFRSTPSALRASPPKPRGEESRKFLVIETGAYRKGEIGTVAKIIQPQYAILTGLNHQHVELFGRIENTRAAKFELAEGTSKTVFFNGDNPYLTEIFADRQITATPVAISKNSIYSPPAGRGRGRAESKTENTNIKSYPDRSEFTAYGQKFTLPWPGEFFVHNALLALELCRELGADPKKLTKHLKSLPPLERALSLSTHKKGFTVLRDTYSANPDGVLSAINHLKNFKGRRVFVSIPLRELGGHAPTVHAQIFEKLKDLNAEVYWEKTDFADLGKEILGKNFHQVSLFKGDLEGFKKLEKLSENLKQDDVVLLESKLSPQILNLF